MFYFDIGVVTMSVWRTFCYMQSVLLVGKSVWHVLLGKRICV